MIYFLALTTLAAIGFAVIATAQSQAAIAQAEHAAALLEIAVERCDVLLAHRDVLAQSAATAIEQMELREKLYAHRGVRAWQRRQRRTRAPRLVWVKSAAYR